MKLRVVALLIGLFLIVGGDVSAGDSCIACHGNAEKMKELGYPQFIFTASEVSAQTRMPASCSDCHRGDPSAPAKDIAHKAQLTVKAIRQKTWEAVSRNSMGPEELRGWPYLEPRGENKATRLLPKQSFEGKLEDNPDYKLIILHDRNSGTLAFNPTIAEETCGKPAEAGKCHGDIVSSFLKSSMGGGQGGHTQSQYRIWTGKTEPQSCGLWVGELTKPSQDQFTDENIRYFNLHSTMSLSEKTAFNLQRTCNQCHVGCLDCHFEAAKRDPQNPAKGPHTFIKRPSPLSCYGGGKSFSCHAGPLERRRGDGYIRAEFTQAAPEGIRVLREKGDVHMRKNISCVDCHQQNRETGHHADLRRDVRCETCHEGIVKAYREGPHRKVDCASCHTALIGGYAFNFWSAVGPKGQENPVTRIQDYTTDAVQPLIIRSPKGVWIPVHVVPHTSGNVKADEVRQSKKLLFRNRPDSEINRRYFSNDSYAVTGLVRGIDEKDHDTMVWLNLDRVAHGTGKARGCDSCHASATQKIRVRFSGGSYKDVEDGEYSIIADGKSLRVADFKGPGGGAMPKGLGSFKDLWSLNGDFSLPILRDRERYERMKKEYEAGTFVH